MNRALARIALGLLCALATLAVPVRAAAELPPGIDWFEGSVEQAFDQAKSDGKPLFLYWGAVWCPPCVEIRQTVFKSSQFLAQTKLFLPVYLDGDTEQAQAWGDRFGTRVYPTMIVFNPAGEEVTRLNAGIDVSAYNDVLGLSLERMRPTADLVRQARRDPSSLGAADFRQLAYYSWYDGEALPEDAGPGLFLALSDAAAEVDPEAGARLYLQHLAMLADEPGEADERSPDQVARLTAILESPDLMIACWDYLIVPETIDPALTGDPAHLHALKAQWAQRVLDLRHSERLSTKNRLYGWRPWLVFHREADDAEREAIPEHVLDAIRADGRAAAATVAGSQARQSVINTVANVYLLAGLDDDARALLTAEIAKSRTPYYFMGSLAALEEEQGNAAAALEWRRKAYQASEGPATRIRWWASYVQALTRLAPGDEVVIRRTAMEVFAPGSGMEDIFSGANFRNLQRAAVSLEAWREASAAEKDPLAPFHSSLRSACEAQVGGSVERSNCRSLVDTGASGRAG